MQPATIRRLLVFGVCLVAVSCLYLLPSVSSTSSQISTSSGPHDSRTTPPGAAAGDVSGPARGTPSQSGPVASELPDPLATPRADATPGSINRGSVVDTTESTGSAAAPTQEPTTQRVSAPRGQPAATAVDPRTDHVPPTAITRLWTTGTDQQELGLAWTAATDDRGSVWYEVSVNGFAVTTTQQTDATVRWFNDASTHVVQVRAVDLAGNKGPWSPTLLVTRPSPSPQAEQAEKAPTNAGVTSATTPSDSSSPKEDNS